MGGALSFLKGRWWILDHPHDVLGCNATGMLIINAWTSTVRNETVNWYLIVAIKNTAHASIVRCC